MDAGGVIRYTQVGFEAGDEKKYEQVVQQLLRECAALAPPRATVSQPAGASDVVVPKSATGQTMLFYTAESTDNPHRAVLPLLFAVTAREQGHNALLFFAGDGTLLMKDSVAADIKAVGQPNAADLLRRAGELKIPIYV